MPSTGTRARRRASASPVSLNMLTAPIPCSFALRTASSIASRPATGPGTPAAFISAAAPVSLRSVGLAPDTVLPAAMLSSVRGTI